MVRNIVALAAGIVFGLGLAVSQMTNPEKVLSFLDVAGAWDPSLAFVMGGAVIVSMVMFRLVLKRPQPVFGHKFYLPTRESIDTRLVGGGAVFGIGWGLVGLCPGPAISSLAFGQTESFVFVAAMLVGSVAARFMPTARAEPSPQEAAA